VNQDSDAGECDVALFETVVGIEREMGFRIRAQRKCHEQGIHGADRFVVVAIEVRFEPAGGQVATEDIGAEFANRAHREQERRIDLSPIPLPEDFAEHRLVPTARHGMQDAHRRHAPSAERIRRGIIVNTHRAAPGCVPCLEQIAHHAHEMHHGRFGLRQAEIGELVPKLVHTCQRQGVHAAGHAIPHHFPRKMSRTLAPETHPDTRPHARRGARTAARMSAIARPRADWKRPEHGNSIGTTIASATLPRHRTS